MQERVDKATAAQIGKAVRVWYTDYKYDQFGLCELECFREYLRLLANF